MTPRHKRFSFDIDNERLRRIGPLLLAGLVTLLTIALYLDDHRLLATWELGIQDVMVSMGRKPAAPADFVIVSIDDEAIESLGPWPWDAERVGFLVGMLGEYKPKAIGLDFEISDDATTEPSGNQFLADMIARAGNVIVPMRFHLGGISSIPSHPGEFVLRSSIVTIDQAIELMDQPFPHSQRLTVPYEAASEAAWGLGQTNTWQDVDGKVRRDPLIVKFEGEYYPSMALQLASCARGLHRAQIQIIPHEGVRLGETLIPTDDAGMMLIDYRGPAGTFRSTSAARILSGQAGQKEIEGKIVIVGVTASGYGTTLRTPASEQMPRSEKIATVAANILSNRFITTVRLSTFIDILVFLLIGGFCALVLPRTILVYRIAMLMVMGMLFVNLNYILYGSFQLITKTLYPSLQILFFLFLSPVMKPWTKDAGGEQLTKTGRRKLNRSLDVVSGPIPVVSQESVPPAIPSSSDGVPVRVIREHGPTGTIDGLEQTTTISTIHTAAPAPSSQPPPPLTDSTPPELGQTMQIPNPSDLMDATPHPLGANLTASGSIDTSPESAATEETVSKRLGRYEVLDVLGQGAMGTVYRGKDPAIDRMVALKTIRAGLSDDEKQAEELRERLVREAKAAGKLSHPNIVTIYDVGAEGSLRYIAMEYLEGYTLEQVIKKKVQLNYRIAAKIIMQVCDALEYAHRAGIVHRDIKPANIMVLDNFEIKVTDFGIARFDSPQMSMTQTGIAMGTPHYISPEQLRGEPVDRRCDIFSLGVVTYELLTRQRPFAGENMSQLIYSITQTEPDPPSAIDENIPGLFDMVVRKALAKNPTERYQSAEQMGQALRAFVEELATSSYRV